MSNNEPKRYPSRLKKKKNRSNAILNGMIGLVFALILITGAFIFLGNDKETAQELETVQISTESEEQASETDSETEEATTAEDAGQEQSGSASEKSQEENSASETDDKEADEATDEKEGMVIGGTITREASNDPIVEETVINTSWKAVKTSQKGEHVSVYETDSVDWKEKVEAISYATGLKEDNMYVMRIQNGGGPQKSIGVVQSKDQQEKYRVHLEWVDGKGWKPVKMDILKTLEGAY